MNGFLKNANEQIVEACEKIANDSHLKNGYNAIGFSQGSQFLYVDIFAVNMWNHYIIKYYYVDIVDYVDSWCKYL